MHDATAASSKIGAVPQLIDDGGDLASFTVADELGWRLAVQQLLSGIEPQPGFLRIVEVGQLIDDVFEIEQDLLRVGTWKGLALIRTGDRLRPGPEYVRDVDGLHRALLLDDFQPARYRIGGGHARRSFYWIDFSIDINLAQCVDSCLRGATARQLE